MEDVNDLQPYLDTFDSAAGYLDWAAFGPLSPAVRAETLADAELLGSGRRSGIDLVSERSDEARGLVAQVLGCSVDEVVLQPSTTHGLQHAMQGLRGVLVVSAQEFPALRVTARRAQDARGVLSVREIDPSGGIVTADAVAEALDDEVTAVAVSLVDFRTGAVADLAAIRDRIGDRLLIVDAVQGFAVVDADWDAADVVCGNGYKWLRAGRGTGFARFSDRARERIEPVLSGISGMQGDASSVGVPAPLPTAAAYQVAPADHLAAGRLAAALREVLDAGIPDVAAELRSRARAVMDLADRYGIPVVTPRDRHAGIVALQPAPHEAAPLAAALANHGVTVTARGATIRVAPHVGTGADSFVLLGDAFAELAAARAVVEPGPAAIALPEPGSSDDLPVSLEVTAAPTQALEASSPDDITR